MRPYDAVVELNGGSHLCGSIETKDVLSFFFMAGFKTFLMPKRSHEKAH